MSLTPPAHSAKNYVLPFLIIIAIGVTIILLFRLYDLMKNGGELADTLGSIGKAELIVSSGEVEVYLPASLAWKIIDTSATLSAGESVRTGSDGSARLAFDDGSEVILDHGTEVALTELKNSLAQKVVTLTLARGNLYTLASTSNALTLQTNLLTVSDLEGNSFLFHDATTKQIQLAVISGAAVGTILDPQNSTRPEIKKLAVEPNKTLTISERRVNLLRIGGEISLVEPTPTDVSQTPFFLANSAGIPSSPSDALVTSPTLISDQPAGIVTPETSGTTTLTAPVVTSFVGNTFTTSADRLVISGAVSPLTTKLEVAHNTSAPYELKKFVAGSVAWSYNVGTALGNLALGKNTYTVVAIDKDGVRSTPTIFTITYTPKTISTNDSQLTTLDSQLPATTPVTNTDGTSGVPAVGGSTSGAPIVTSPTDGATYTTLPIRFSGSVPAGTASIVVNGYVLTKYTPGSTTWYYTADTQYGNITPGENEYEITATSDTGVQSSVTVKIKYAPEAGEGN